MKKKIFSVLAPQINVNDEAIDFIEWRIPNKSYIKKGDIICAVETAKSAVDIMAEDEGFIFQIALPNTVVKVGERIGIIADSLETIANLMTENNNKPKEPTIMDSDTIKATSKAKALAKKYGIEIEKITKTGIKGTIKETDVHHYISENNKIDPHKKGFPSTILNYAKDTGPLLKHQSFMARKLRNSLQEKLPTTIESEIDLTGTKYIIKKYEDRGIIISLLHIIMFALGKALPNHPEFIKFQLSERIFCYNNINLAIIVKTLDDHLYSPVIKNPDKLTIKQIAQDCQKAVFCANRHQLKPSDMEGACLTISCIPHYAVTRFTAIIDQFQSAIIAVSGEHKILKLKEDKIIEIPVSVLTLSYDHTIIDGWYAANFLASLKNIMESIVFDENDR